MQLSIVAFEYIDHNFQSSGFAASPSSEKKPPMCSKNINEWRDIHVMT
jgi:hypothetical protein